MKLLTYIEQGKERLGIRTDSGVIPVFPTQETPAIPAIYEGTPLPLTIRETIEGGTPAVKALEAYASAYASSPLNEAELAWGPCVPGTGKIVCVGLNYRRHAEETGAEVPSSPILFNKFGNAIAAHGDSIAWPSGVTSELDYEAELAIIIGREAKNVAVEDALDYVFGYCCANDLSARDLQRRTSQWMLGKSLDGFCPVGPYLVTADEVGDPNVLGISCSVNGGLRQQSNTSDMIFRCDEIVSYISRHMTLQPGDLILTGTPEGVALGMPPETRAYLKDGDQVTVSIDRLGSLSNRIVETRTT